MDGPAVSAAVRDVEFPAGDGLAWVAGESSMVKAVRAHLRDDRGHSPEWVWASGYWNRGTPWSDG